MNEIIPGILEHNWQEIEQKLQIVKPFAKAIHIDIIDGKFAPNTTFLDPGPFQKYTNDFFFELHMMVENPIQYVESWGKAGFKRFIGQIEKMSDQGEFVKKAHKFGEAFLAIDAKSAINDITVAGSDLDGVLIMTINAGFSGQEFQPELLKKVRGLRYQNKVIEVDGGINDKTILEAKETGATRFVTTSFLFDNPNPRQAFDILTNLIA